MFQKDQLTQNRQKLAILQTISTILNKYESQRKKVAFWSYCLLFPIISFLFLTLILILIYIIFGLFYDFDSLQINFLQSPNESEAVNNLYFWFILSQIFAFPIIMGKFIRVIIDIKWDLQSILISPILFLFLYLFLSQLFSPLFYTLKLLLDSPNLVTKKILGKKFRHSFKNEVIPKVLSIANSNLIYEPNKKLESKKVVQSGLFWKLENEKQEPNSQFLKSQNRNYQIEIEDFMTEIVPKFGLQIAEINIKNLDFHARSLISKKLISNGFQGLFISANFVNTFANEKILTKSLFLFPPEFATNPQTPNNEILSKVILESPVFTKNFEVFGDQLEARLVLQTDIMDRLNFLKEKYQRPILASFIDDKLSIAVEFGTDLFESTVFVPARTELIEEFIETVEIIQDLVVSLKLRKAVGG